MGLITTAEAAERLGVHRTRIGVLIKSGRLPAQRFGKVYLIDESDLSLVSDRKPGRPPKAQIEIDAGAENRTLAKQSQTARNRKTGNKARKG